MIPTGPLLLVGMANSVIEIWDEHTGDRCHVHVNGELDISSTPELRHHLEEVLARRGTREIVVHLERTGYIDSTAVAIRTKKGRLALINTSRRAAYGYDQRFEVLGSLGMLQAGNHTPTEVMASTAANVSRDKPEHFFLERYAKAYANEMAHFFDALAKGGPMRTSIDDGVKALELAEAATTSWREKRIVDL